MNDTPDQQLIAKIAADVARQVAQEAIEAAKLVANTALATAANKPKEETTNGVLKVTLDYIKDDIKIIKADVKEMKGDYISRREFTEIIVDIRREMQNEISPLKKFVYGIISVLGIAVLGSLINLVINK